MKLDAGNILINKPIEKVYSFLTRLENLEKQVPQIRINNYEIEFEDNIYGAIELRTIITMYFFALFEDDEDMCCEFEVAYLEKNEKIESKLVYIGKYNEEKDDWSNPIPMDKYFGVMGFEMKFTPINGKTQVFMVSTFRPKSIIFGVALRVLNFMGRVSSKKYYKEWAKLVEQNA